MFFRHSFDKLIYPVLALALLAAFSYRPKYHLRSDMPPEFFRSFATSDAKGKQSLDQKIAWAYWESAQMDIQWKYPHGKTLPSDPPLEFRVNAQALGPAAADPAIRQLFWRRLQDVWYAPETWQKQYEWDWSWASDPLSSAGQWLREEADEVLKH
jgi:hypothetical protein